MGLRTEATNPLHRNNIVVPVAAIPSSGKLSKQKYGPSEWSGALLPYCNVLCRAGYPSNSTHDAAHTVRIIGREIAEQSIFVRPGIQRLEDMLRRGEGVYGRVAEVQVRQKLPKHLFVLQPAGKVGPKNYLRRLR